MRTTMITGMLTAGLLCVLSFQNCAKSVGGAGASSVPAATGGGSDLTPLTFPEEPPGSTSPVTSLIANRLDQLQIRVNDSAEARLNKVIARVTLNTAIDYDLHLNVDTVDGTAKEREHFNPPAGKLTIPAGRTSGEIAVPLPHRTAMHSSQFTVKISGPSVGTITRSSAKVTIPAWTPYEALRNSEQPTIAPDYPGKERVQDVTCAQNKTTKKTVCQDPTKDATFFDLLLQKGVLCGRITSAGSAVCQTKAELKGYELQPEGGFCVPKSAQQDSCFIQRSGALAFLKRRGCEPTGSTAVTENMLAYVCAK